MAIHMGAAMATTIAWATVIMAMAIDTKERIGLKRYCNRAGKSIKQVSQHSFFLKNLFLNNTRSLSGFSSLFLDILRLACAFAVVFSHCILILMPEKMQLWSLYEIGHGAVII